jgi:hypothetical protein
LRLAVVVSISRGSEVIDTSPIQILVTLEAMLPERDDRGEMHLGEREVSPILGIKGKSNAIVGMIGWRRQVLCIGALTDRRGRKLTDKLVVG